MSEKSRNFDLVEALNLYPRPLATPAASQSRACDPSSAVSPCIDSGQRDTNPRLLLRARHSFILSTVVWAFFWLNALGGRPRSFERLAAFDSLRGQFLSNPPLDTPCLLLSGPLRSPRCSSPPPRAQLDFGLLRSDLGSSDLAFVSRMSRQNPRRPTVLAGDNPAERTRGFHFKIVPDSSASRVAASSFSPSEPMASLASSLAGPSHPQIGAGASSAAAVPPRPAASSADFDDRRLGRVSNARATSGLHAFGALPQSPIELQASREAPGGCYQLSEPNGYLPARQVRENSFRPRAHHSSDTTNDQSHRSPDREIAFESEVHQGPDFVRAF